jgi:cytochrome c peroxidase
MLGYRGILVASGIVLVALGGGVWLSLAPQPAEAVRTYTPPSTELPITPIPDSLNLDPRKVDLGRRLFHDKRLSGSDTISCASCHDLKQAGVDAKPVAIGIRNQVGTVNSPTVLNSTFNFRQFWDGRAATLEEQAEGPVHNPIEMASNWPQVINKLSRDAQYVKDFNAIWPDGIQSAHIQSAIAEFERSLITPDSAFDRYLKGDAQALSAEARKGWDLFRNLGCIACHQGVNMGGNMYANLGIMGDFFAERGKPVVKSDLGRFNVTGRQADRHMFKVPSLRNIARTGPYFHDGSIAELEKAVETMARYQLGVELSEPDRNLLVSFLKSLSGQPPVAKP